MRYTVLVLKAQMKNVLRWRIVAAIIFGIAIICIIGVTVLFITQFILPELKKASPDQLSLENFLGLVLFITSFCCVGIYSSVFTAQTLIREKARGNIQALLATPVSAGNICLGKTLGAFIPGFLLCIPITAIMLLFINLVYLAPTTGFIITPWMMFSSLIAVPLVFLSLTLLVNLVGMTGKATTGNIIAQVPLATIGGLMNYLAQTISGASAGSWLFTVILLGIAGIFGILVLIFRPKLTAERIILSQ
jgi:ABC-type Na+ efflux pump permease subunit